MGITLRPQNKQAAFSLKNHQFLSKEEAFHFINLQFLESKISLDLSNTCGYNQQSWHFSNKIEMVKPIYMRYVEDTHRSTYVINEVVTSKLLGPLNMGGTTDTIKNVPRSQEKIKAPALHHKLAIKMRTS